MNIEYFDSDYGQNWFCDIILMEIMANIHWKQPLENHLGKGCESESVLFRLKVLRLQLRWSVQGINIILRPGFRIDFWRVIAS